MTALLSDLSDIGGYSGDFYFTSAISDSNAWLQETLPSAPKDDFAVLYNPSFNFDETHGGENFQESLALLNSDYSFEYPGSIEPKLKRMRLSTEDGLKRGPKHMTAEERQISKNAFMKLYQDIWRLLFRKNSTVTLTERGKMCCSYFVSQTLLKCPSGKSPDHDLFRTIEHLWNVIYLSASLNSEYGLKQYFFMKCLISWKLQPRFTDAIERPDVETLENDRVFQNGKKRSSTNIKIIGELHENKRAEIINLNDSLWKDLEMHELNLNTKDLPSMTIDGIRLSTSWAEILSPSNTNYYYKGTGDLKITSNWGTNLDGSGSNPPNFTSASQSFNIANTTNAVLTGTWSVSGSNSKIIIIPVSEIVGPLFLPTSLRKNCDVF